METSKVDIDPSARAIINTNYDTNNIVSMDDARERIEKTLESCITILKEHCGPQSGYAMLVNNMSAGINFEPNVFTRDGIRILSAIEFLSPLERYIKDLLTYIGTRVDNVAKDGTTTSMLFSALFLKNVISMMDEFDDYDLSIFQMNKVVDQAFKDILSSLERYTFNIEKMNDTEVDETTKVKTAGYIAFMQALSSSGGNLDLAVAMKEIFERSPSVSWDFITSHNSVKETGKPFEVETCPYDARIRCTVGIDNIFNSALNTEYEAENAKVIVITIPIDDMGTTIDALMNYLKADDDTQPIVIISTLFSGSFTQKVSMFNSVRKHPISFWQYAPEYKLAGISYPYELLILAAIAGVTPYDFDNDDAELSDAHVFKASRVHWHDTYLDFYGVYETNGAYLHPFYAYPDTATKFYTETRESLERQISMYRDGHKPDGKMYGVFMEMLNKIACVHRPTLRLGGPVHEQIANNDVVQDVQGAIMSSLKHGFLINGPMSILFALTDTLTKYQELVDTNKNTEYRDAYSFAFDIVSCMHSAIKDIVNTLHEEDLSSVLNEMREDPEKYTNVLEPGVRNFSEYVKSISDFSTTEELSQEDMISGSTYPVLQPVTITQELLKRVRELLMKFIKTNKIVVYGGVVVKDEGKDK